MRVLVTGSTGFIGSALVASLEGDGHVVHRLVRHAPADGEVAIDLSRHALDTTRLPGGSLDGIDLVFNLAGEPLVPRRWTPARRERIFASRVTTTNVLAWHVAQLASPPAAFVSISATGYYGSRDEEVLVEGSSAGVGFLAECCRAWEAACSPARERGIRVALARSGVVLGSGGGMLSALVPLFRRGLGGRLGTGRQWMSWISLDDEIRALRYLSETTACEGSYNIVSSNPVRNAEFTAALARALRRPALLAVPRRALVAVAGRRVTDEFLLASQRVKPQRLEHADFSFLHEDIGAALAVALASDVARS